MAGNVDLRMGIVGIGGKTRNFIKVQWTWTGHGQPTVWEQNDWTVEEKKNSFFCAL